MIKKLIILFKLGRKIAKSDILKITSKFQEPPLLIKFLFKILAFSFSEKKKVDLNQDIKPEFDTYEWVTYWHPLGKIIDFKKEAYRKVLTEFAEQM